ncbi:hypothetical protein A5724_07230 [Mycobacterium sp. ACS1612]|uniref:hypothetical protein n=1 Tax=Mycobacterium sp. ACS1612 TaxID=1834117 RepID=UPI00080082AB|nr:hypothetical protein [Mycobacterium sp. ACS1612]OBF40565.1 hypothetical protein A5724_07230 [Mycobacterium sp. ACS1612]
MNFKRVIGSVAIASAIGVSSLGIGAGVANASTDSTHSGTAVVQPVDWRGYGHGHDWGHGYGRGFRGGWPDNHWWHPWFRPWRW